MYIDSVRTYVASNVRSHAMCVISVNIHNQHILFILDLHTYVIGSAKINHVGVKLHSILLHRLIYTQELSMQTISTGLYLSGGQFADPVN